jgi:phosphate transport system substrate-binding protein
MTKEQLMRIFTGEDGQWKGSAAFSGPIHIYARDDKSGTYDTFKTLVLNGKPLSNTAKRFESSEALSDSVAGDPEGIGFIGLPFVRDAKAVAVSEKGTEALLPTALTVATEDYALSRRLYLYTPANPANEHVRQFVEFALSKAGQQVVAAEGFVPQTAELIAQKAGDNAPPEYRRLTAGASRIPIDFRFQGGESQLDNRALADLDRVVAQLAQRSQTGGTTERVMLFGFSDSAGSDEANLALSVDRARIVASEFARRGLAAVTVKGYGSSLPVAANDTPEGRQKNRRVEIWVSD